MWILPNSLWSVESHSSTYWFSAGCPPPPYGCIILLPLGNEGLTSDYSESFMTVSLISLSVSKVPDFCAPLAGPWPVGTLAQSLASWAPCHWVAVLALAVDFRYSTESYLLLLRRVNSHLIPGTLPEYLHLVYLAPSQALTAFGSGGRISKGYWEKPLLCILP